MVSIMGCQRHENGQKSLEAKYKYGGKREGSRMEWHENGQKKSESNYKDGNLEGSVSMWHENGKSMLRNWKDGKENGLDSLQEEEI